MVKHFNPSIGQWLLRIFRFKGMNVRSEVLPYITPTMEIKPVMNSLESNNFIVTGPGTVWTTPSTKDFYLDSIEASYAKDAACDIATGRLLVSVVVDGLTKPILAFSVLTLTAQYGSESISFPIPIKVDRGTQIIFSGAYTAGLMARCAQIQGHFEENTVSSQL